jgi:hypothetical protein
MTFMKLGSFAFAVIGTIFFSTVATTVPSRAHCYCRCVDGKVLPLCTNTVEVPPVCAARVCPPGPASLAPVVAPKLPPVGTTVCRQAQVCDHRGNCRWRQVCE